MEHTPTDYEPCGTCGYDHSYDLPLLNEEEAAEVAALHADEGSVKFEAERV